MRKSRVLRTMAVAGVALVAASGLTACSADKVATCSEFASMSPDTGLFTSPNSKQTSALKTSLKAAGYDDSDFNVAIGFTEVLAYCNIYDGVANQNQSQPISNAH